MTTPLYLHGTKIPIVKSIESGFHGVLSSHKLEPFNRDMHYRLVLEPIHLYKIYTLVEWLNNNKDIISTYNYRLNGYMICVETEFFFASEEDMILFQIACL